MSEDITKVQEIFYELRVQEVMTSDVITVTPQTTMGELGELLRAHRISGAPVIEDGELVGIISIQDLIQALQVCQIEQPVAAWMTRQVKALDPHERVVSSIQELEKVVAVASLLELAAVIVTEGVSPDSETIYKAQTEGITLLGSSQDTYTVVGDLAALGITGTRRG